MTVAIDNESHYRRLLLYPQNVLFLNPYIIYPRASLTCEEPVEIGAKHI